MGYQPNIGKINIVPAGTRTGKAGTKIHIYSANMFRDNPRLKTKGMPLHQLFRVQINGRWHWPAPKDKTMGFIPALDLWALVWRHCTIEMGIKDGMASTNDDEPNERKHLAKINVVPAGTRTGKATTKLRAFAAAEFEDKERIWIPYQGCDLNRLYRLEINGRWFWPRATDKRHALLTADELWGLIVRHIAQDLGLPSIEPPRPSFPAPGMKVRFLGAHVHFDKRTFLSSFIMGEPFLDNGVWRINLVGERQSVACNAVSWGPLPERLQKGLDEELAKAQARF